MTGGEDEDNKKLKTVTRYYENGSWSEMPNMQVARVQHACSAFINNAGLKVYENLILIVDTYPS